MARHDVGVVWRGGGAKALDWTGLQRGGLQEARGGWGARAGRCRLGRRCGPDSRAGPAAGRAGPARWAPRRRAGPVAAGLGRPGPAPVQPRVSALHARVTLEDQDLQSQPHPSGWPSAVSQPHPPYMPCSHHPPSPPSACLSAGLPAFPSPAVAGHGTRRGEASRGSAARLNQAPSSSAGTRPSSSTGKLVSLVRVGSPPPGRVAPTPLMGGGRLVSCVAPPIISHAPCPTAHAGLGNMIPDSWDSREGLCAGGVEEGRGWSLGRRSLEKVK